MTLTKSLADVELKEDGDKGIVTAVFSTFDVIDLDGDVTRKGAFTEGAPVVISAYGHRSWDGELPIGSGVIHERAKDAVMEGEFFLDTTHGRDAWGAIKRLSKAGLQEWSYSLDDITAEPGEVDGEKVRILKRIVVKEVSPVLKGAGINTRTLTLKSGDSRFSDHVEAVLTALDEITDRAMEVVTLRAEQGKSYTSVTDLQDQINERVAAFKQRLDDLVHPPTPFDDDAVREFLRSVAAAQGVTLS